MRTALPGISILIVTHNRAGILTRTLDCLGKIEIPDGAQVELIVVANVCSDDTRAVVERMATTMPFATRCVEESAIGVAHARNRALEESRGEIIIYVDDDVFVGGGWLKGMLEVLNSAPADIIAGKLTLCWDAVAKPAWMTSRSEHLLSCTDHGENVVELTQGGLAVTANFAMRRRVVDKIGNFSVGLGRTGKAVLAGEDTEFFNRALRTGFRIFYSPTASALHWVAPHRITPKYLSAAAFGNGMARPYLEEHFTKGNALVMIFKQMFKTAAYSVATLFSYCFLGKRAYINSLVRFSTSYGMVRGAFRRLGEGKQTRKSGTVEKLPQSV